MQENFKQKWFTVVILLLVFTGSFSVTVQRADAASYKSFIVEEVIGTDKLLITDGSSYYLVTYGFFGCSSWDFSPGKIIYIDTYFTPSLFNKILVEGIGDTKVCDIRDSEDLNLKKYYVDSVIDSKDNVIVIDKYGTKYLVEYGIGCLSMWRYEGKNIDIDIGGSFLDGIGDRIYLFDSDDDCKVWDADELNSSSISIPSYSIPTSIPSIPSCPTNSTRVDGICKCNDGYVANSAGNACTTVTESCQSKYGSNVYAKEGLCYCKDGYSWNQDKTACYVILTPPPTSKPTPVVIPILSQVLKTPTPVIKECENGYVPSLNKKGCVRIPANAHPADNGRDVWLCNDGFEEVVNSCIAIKNETIASQSKNTIQDELAEDNFTFVDLLKVLRFWRWF